jgi:hypothetical protein
MRITTPEQIARLQQLPDAPKRRRFRRPRLTRDPVFVLLTLGVLALILAVLGSVGDRRPSIGPEAPAKTSGPQQYLVQVELSPSRQAPRY